LRIFVKNIYSYFNLVKEVNFRGNWNESQVITTLNFIQSIIFIEICMKCTHLSKLKGNNS
jgi:hypothetical protein